MLTLPAKVRRKKQPYLYLRSRLSRRNLRKQAILFYGELRDFIAAKGIVLTGPGFMRYMTVQQDGELDMEFGYFTDRLYSGGGPIRAGVLPSGTFMSTHWTGPFENVPDVNAMLEGWADHNGVEWDAAETPEGTSYGCRIEIYHVTPRHISDPMQFRTEVAIMVRSAAETKAAPETDHSGLGNAPSFSHLAIDNWRNE
jgi:effector-binding domain-containing protein